MRTPAPSERARVRRLPARADYDRDTIASILREGFVAHVGIHTQDGPFVLPMVYGFDGEWIYLHGSPASRLLRHLAGGAALCLTVTLLDGLVLARSAFHHSMNYRSVTVLGNPVEVTGREEKLRALHVVVEHVVPGRAAGSRPPSERELAATLVVKLPVSEAAAKVRTGPPLDDAEDVGLAHWAGELPIALAYAAPVPAPGLRAGLAPPACVGGYGRP